VQYGITESCDYRFSVEKIVSKMGSLLPFVVVVPSLLIFDVLREFVRVVNFTVVAGSETVYTMTSIA